MNIEFDNAALEELYVSGVTKDNKYKKLSKDIVKRYIKVVNFIRAARRIEDLFLIKSLHYEKRRAILKALTPFGLTTNIACSSIVFPMVMELL